MFYVKKCGSNFSSSYTIKHESIIRIGGMSQCYTLHSELIMLLQFLSLGGIEILGVGNITNQKNFQMMSDSLTSQNQTVSSHI
jgi:hypothetical protein